MTIAAPTAHSIDLQRYFDRIGYVGEPRADLPTLQTLTRCHCEAIPFENIDVLLDRGVRLDVATLEDKLVTRARGGYCFEQNGLLLAVLRQIGFDATPLSARIRLGRPNRAQPSPRTHMLIQVVIAGEVWLTDVGIGATSLTGALRLRPDEPQETPHDLRRLERVGERWYHQIRIAGAWTDVYEFTLEPFLAVDREMSNWYRSTYPDSPYRKSLTVARARPHGRRVALAGTAFSLREADGAVHKETIASRARLGEILTTQFGLNLPAPTRAELADKLNLAPDTSDTARAATPSEGARTTT